MSKTKQPIHSGLVTLIQLQKMVLPITLHVVFTLGWAAAAPTAAACISPWCYYRGAWRSVAFEFDLDAGKDARSFLLVYLSQAWEITDARAMLRHLIHRRRHCSWSFTCRTTAEHRQEILSASNLPRSFTFGESLRKFRPRRKWRLSWTTRRFSPHF